MPSDSPRLLNPPQQAKALKDWPAVGEINTITRGLFSGETGNLEGMAKR